MMHIALIIYGSIETLTGGFLYDNFLIRHLERQGHKVEILSLPWRPYHTALLDNFSPNLHARLRHASWDILLQDELTHPSLFLLNTRLRRDVSYPIVTIVHQVLCQQPRNRWKNAFYRMIEGRYLRSIDACIFNSQATRQTVEAGLGLSRPAIVAPPGGDRLGWLGSAAEIWLRAQKPGPLQLLFIGNVLPNKGVYELIQALAGVERHHWRLTVIGSLSMHSAYVNTVKHLIQQQGLNAHIHFTGPLDGDDVIPYLQQSHLFVMPFSHEGFGIAYLEGMAYGLPAIGSTQGAVKEFIRPGENGFLIAPAEANRLQHILEHLSQDRAHLARLGTVALETCSVHPSWRESLESIHQFLVTVATCQSKNPIPATSVPEPSSPQRIRGSD